MSILRGAFCIIVSVEKITLMLSDIEYLCKHVTQGHELCEDLQQEVVLALLETKKETIEELDLNELKKYATSIVYKKWFTGDGREMLGDKNVRSFTYKFRDFNLLSQTDIEHFKYVYRDEQEEFNELEEKY